MLNYYYFYVFLVLYIVVWPLIFYGCASYCEVWPCTLFCVQFLCPSVYQKLCYSLLSIQHSLSNYN